MLPKTAGRRPRQPPLPSVHVACLHSAAPKTKSLGYFLELLSWPQHRVREYNQGKRDKQNWWTLYLKTPPKASVKLQVLSQPARQADSARVLRMAQAKYEKEWLHYTKSHRVYCKGSKYTMLTAALALELRLRTIGEVETVLGAKTWPPAWAPASQLRS